MVEESTVPAGAVRVDPEAAVGFVATLFAGFGVPPDHARMVGGVLVAADARGIRSHGLARIPYFLIRLERGVIQPDPVMAFRAGSPTTGVLDAGDGIGIVAAGRALAEAMTMAEEHGSGFVAVKDSSHFGYAGYWAEQAMRAGYIGLALSNSAGRVAPTFGTAPILGTNPLAVAIPGAPGATDFLLDMATSAVAVGKVETALREGREPHPGWVTGEQVSLDENGVLGFDCALLPLGGEGTETGGHKGYGLGLMVELLCGAVSGTSFAARLEGASGAARPAMGHLVAALRLDGFGPKAAIQEEMESTFAAIRSSPKAEGRDRIYIHGEPEQEAVAEAARAGIVVTPPVLSQLDAWAQRLDVAPIPR